MIRASGPLDRRASTNTTMTDPTTPPLLTDEQLKNIEQNPECWSHAGPYLLFRSDKYDRALESAVRAPLLADIERLTRERDEARAELATAEAHVATTSDVNASLSAICVRSLPAAQPVRQPLTDEQRVDYLCEAAEFTCGQWQVVIDSDNPSFLDAFDAEAMRANGITGEPAAQPVAVPDGYKLVKTPITEEMHVAACKVLTKGNGLDGLPQRMLDAMLAVAPKGGCSMNVETETWHESDEALKAELQRAGFLNGRGVGTAEGTLENFRLLIKNLIGGTAQPPSAPDANCVTRSSALAALSHLGQNNGPARLAEAHNMLVAATKP